MTGHPSHPACAKWPWPSDAEFNKLVEDIRVNGLLNDIWLTKDGLLLDGKVREKACGIAGVAPRFATYQGDDPFGFSISQNARRRHMPRHELAFLVEELATLAHGGPRLPGKPCPSGLTIDGAAKSAGISAPAIEDARAIKRYGDPKVISLARGGEVRLRYAAHYARSTPRSEQAKATASTITQIGKALAEKSKHRTKTEDEITITLNTVVKTLRPLVNLIKEQSKQRDFMVSLASLSLVAQAFEMIFKAWAKGDDAEVERISRHVGIDYVRDSNVRTNNEYFRNQAAQQRDQGADPGSRCRV